MIFQRWNLLGQILFMILTLISSLLTDTIKMVVESKNYASNDQVFKKIIFNEKYSIQLWTIY
tara:strand:+ start:3815 stop:4000 length:186 start_codon:yes stop_codon:yes gene_type:complete